MKKYDPQLTHPFVQSIISSLDRSLEGVTAARFIVKENKFREVKGFLHIYELTISNNIDPARKYTIPIFIEMNGQYNTRISRSSKTFPDFYEELIYRRTIQYPRSDGKIGLRLCFAESRACLL